MRHETACLNPSDKPARTSSSVETWAIKHGNLKDTSSKDV